MRMTDQNDVLNKQIVEIKELRKSNCVLKKENKYLKETVTKEVEKSFELKNKLVIAESELSKYKIL